MLVGLQNSTGFPSYSSSNAIFYKDTLDKHKSMIEDFKKAKRYIFLEFFIISDGNLLEEVIEVFQKKGEEGVEIYVIYDDVGSKPSLKRKTINRIKNIPNLHINAFSPFGVNINPAINYRDHRKIVVIDGKIAYTGGDNLADEYIHLKERFGKWRDNSIKIEGEAVVNFVLLFLEMWYISSKETLKVEDYMPKEIEHFNNGSLIMPFGDGPTYLSNPTYSLFLNMISSAEQKIYISTPYFIIDKSFINSIVRALKRGVEVVLLLPHVPDKKGVFYMTRGHYDEILRAGGKIYEFTEGFTHAKNMFVDSKYAYIGTSNLDYRSLFLHFECGVFLVDDISIVEMEKDFVETIEVSKRITYESWKDRPFYQKVIAHLLSFFSPLF